MQISIRKLLGRIAKRDEAAMEEFVRLTYKKLYSAAYSVVCDKHLAEDAVQNTYMIIIEKAHTFNPLFGGGMKWLLSITKKNAAYTYRRTKAYRELPLDEEMCCMWTVEDFVKTDIINILDPDEQKAIIMKAMPYKYSEISARTGWNIDKITNLVRNAKKKIEKYLKN